MPQATTNEKIGAIKSYLERREVRQIIESVLPRDGSLTHDVIVRLSVMACKENQRLADCAVDSIANCAIEAASLGLKPGGALAECSFVPFAGRATFMMGYPGMITLALRSGGVLDIMTGCVCEGDVFAYDLGTARSISHVKDDDGDRSKITHAYAHAVLPGGINKIEVMTTRELDKVRKCSAGYKRAEKDKSKQGDSPYHQWPEEMARKAPLRRMFKTLPRSADMQRAYELDIQHEIGASQDFGRAMDLPDPAQLAADESAGAIEANATRVAAQARQAVERPALDRPDPEADRPAAERDPRRHDKPEHAPTPEPEPERKQHTEEDDGGGGWHEDETGAWTRAGDVGDDDPGIDEQDDIPSDDVPSTQLHGEAPVEQTLGDTTPDAPGPRIPPGMPPMVTRFFNRIAKAPDGHTLEKIASECRDCKDAMLAEHLELLRETFLTRRGAIEGDGS